MATISDLNIRLGLLSKDFERDLSRFEKSMKASAERVGKVGEAFSLAFTAPLTAIGGVSVKIAAEFESLRLAMQTSFAGAGRSALEAQQEVVALQKAALAPGLDFEQALKGSVRLQGVGLSAEKARIILAELGNQLASTGGSAEQLDAVTKQFSQIIGKGRLLQEDLSIILENMPGLAKVLREEFGTTSAEAIRALGVSAEDFIDRITTRMQTLPRAAGGLANSIVNAGVAIRQSAANIGEALNKAFNISGNLDAFATWVIDLSESFANLDDDTKALVVGIGVFVAALGPAIKLMSLITSGATSLVATYARVAESFRITAAAGTGTIGMFSRLSTAAKLSIFVGAAGVVLALAAAFSALALAGDEASEGQRLFAEAQKDVTAETAKETAVLNKNFEILKNAASTTEQRTAAIRELQSTYPDYLRNVDLEKASLTQLTEIQGQLNSEILRSVAERQKAIAVEGQYNKIAAAQLRITQLRKEGFAGLTGEEVSRAGASLFGTEFEKGFVLASEQARITQKVIKALEADIQQATGTAKELSDQFDETFQIGTKSANRQFEALTQQRQAMIDAQDALEDMTPAQREALKFAEEWDKRWDAMQKKTSVAASNARQQAKEYKAAVDAIRTSFAALASQGAAPTIETPALPGSVQSVGVDTGGASEAISQLSGVAERGIAAANDYKSAWENVGSVLAGVRDNTIGFTDQFDALAQSVIGTLTPGLQGLANVAISAFSGLTDAVSAGAVSFKTFAAAIGQAVAPAINELLKLFIAKLIANSAFFSANPIAAVVLGGVAAGLGTALFKRAIGAAKLAEGGVLTEPTLALMAEYPGAASNPEIVTPEKKMTEVFESVLRRFQMPQPNVNIQTPQAYPLPDVPALSPAARLQLAPVAVDVSVTGRISNDEILLASDKAAARRGRIR